MSKIPQRIQIELAPERVPFTKTNRFKTWLWNCILPPQIRLHIHATDANKKRGIKV